MARHPLHGRRLEEVAVVEPAAGDAVRRFGEHHLEVELGPWLVEGERGQLERPAAQLERHSTLPHRQGGQPLLLRPPPLLEDEEGLEERRPAGIALRLQPFGEEGERIGLAGEGAEGGGTHPAQKLGEPRVAPEVAGDRHRVDQVAHEAGEPGVGAAGRRAADEEPLLPGVAAEHGVEGREEAHVEGGAALARQPFGGSGHPGIEAERERPAAEALGGRPWPVGRQFENERKPVERLAPGGEDLLPARPGQRLLLPADELGGPDLWRRGRRRQRGELRPAQLPSVERPQVAQDHGERPEVGDDVVHREGEERPLPRAQETQAEERPRRQVERPEGDLAQATPALRRGERRPVLLHDLDVPGEGRRAHPLHRPFRRVVESRAERRVAGG